MQLNCLNIKLYGMKPMSMSIWAADIPSEIPQLEPVIGIEEANLKLSVYLSSDSLMAVAMPGQSAQALIIG